MTKIVPAILTDDNQDLVEQLKLAERYCDRIQVDVMDGSFVPFRSTAGNAISSSAMLEAHLMMDEPDVQEFSNFDLIIVHAEACEDLGRKIAEIKALDLQAGIAINPETSIEKIRQFIPEIDMVLVMTVHPGKQGQRFMPEMLGKVRKIKKEFPSAVVGVDGGIGPGNIKLVEEAGADLADVGSFLAESEDFAEALRMLEGAL